MTDPSSSSHPEIFKTNHINIFWVVDFDKKVLRGHAEYEMQVKTSTYSKLVFDATDINVKELRVNGKPAEFSMSPGVFGTALSIVMPSDLEKNEKFSVKIGYETSDSAKALLWMDPQQTIEKTHPYMYSQCQSIMARTILPCQDTPCDKFTYNAQVTVVSPLTVLMSAVESKPKTLNNDDTVTFHYQQNLPIPSYLLAIVAGKLVSREIGPRSRVWCEQPMVEQAAWEFEETEKFIATAEGLAGEYLWGRYDLLVLPPTFPFGGMENPCLTFVTPALLAGDRSLTHVIAHEISHSWTGNLVTNQTWEDFWLNEGYTRFLERKIISRMYGEATRQFQALGGLKDLQDTINNFGEKSPLTHLVPDLKGVHPEDSFSRVPYEKGFTFLAYLEIKLGGPEKFEPFLRSYINNFKNKSLTTQQWKNYLYEYFESEKSVLDSVEWDAWFHSPGMPPHIPDYDVTMMQACVDLSEKWQKSSDCDEFGADDLNELSTKQRFEFLGELLHAKPGLSADKVRRMNEVYGWSGYKNVEIQWRWLQLAVKSRLEEFVDQAVQFAVYQGREKYVRPMYRLLYNWEFSREKILDEFKLKLKTIHPVTAAVVMKDLKLI